MIAAPTATLVAALLPNPIFRSVSLILIVVLWPVVVMLKELMGFAFSSMNFIKISMEVFANINFSFSPGVINLLNLTLPDSYRKSSLSNPGHKREEELASSMVHSTYLSTAMTIQGLSFSRTAHSPANINFPGALILIINNAREWMYKKFLNYSRVIADHKSLFNSFSSRAKPSVHYYLFFNFLSVMYTLKFKIIKP